MELKIRPATARDASPIAALHAASWRENYRGALSEEYLSGDILSERVQFWRSRLDVTNDLQHVLVAVSGQKIVGFACAFAKNDIRLGTLLDNIHVLSSLHGLGIGSKLLTAIGVWSKSMDPSAGLYLWVLQSNQRAQKFYEHLGARNISSDAWLPPGGGSVPRYCYAWENALELFQCLQKKDSSRQESQHLHPSVHQDKQSQVLEQDF